MSVLFDYLPSLLKGAQVTLLLALLSLALATVLGVFGATGKLSKSSFLRFLASAYTTIIRGVPDLVMILLIYFGLQRVLNIITDLFGAEPIEFSKFSAGVLSIGVIYGAYLTETFRGAYLSVPRGQTEAAQALGLKKFATLFQVVVPQLMRFALPGYANVWQVLIKSTAVVSIIGLQDLVGIANDAGKSVRMPFEFYLFVLFMYLLIYAVSNFIFERLEKRYARGIVHAR